MPKTRTSKNICLHCYGTLDNDRVCLSCRKKADDTPAPPHHLPQRTVLAEKYLIDKALGEGGFGITYLAWDISRGIKVAIKEYFPSGYGNRMPRSNQVIINSKQNQAASNRGLKRFIDEAKVLAKVKNLPGIVSVRDFFSANGTAYIVMEYLDGISLKKYLQRKGGKLPCDDILNILRPVMESLVSVHKLGLIHRDISPDNIIVTKNSEVKLIDFGAAKQSNLDGKSLSIVLKQGFAPEEQYRTHGEQGPWTDIYALGVTIYYAITGTLPPESIQRLYKDTIIRPSEKGAEISPTQESALMKSLAVFARHRYQDVTQMMNGLYGSRRQRAAVTPASSRPVLSVPARESEPAERQITARRTGDATTRPAPISERRTADELRRTAALQRARTLERTREKAQTGTAEKISEPPRPAPTAQESFIRRECEQSAATPIKEQTTERTVTETQSDTPPTTERLKSTTIARERKLTLFERLFGKKKR